MAAIQSPSFNPLAGIRCFLTPYGSLFTIATTTTRFNPLAGIRCFLTTLRTMLTRCKVVGFNPLAGIRCFLTVLVDSMTSYHLTEFQSPSGDSLFSDQILLPTYAMTCLVVSIP